MTKTLRRWGLFIVTNIAIIVMISIVLRVLEAYFGVQISTGWYSGLLVFAAIFWFAGALINLQISRWLAKRAYKIALIDQNIATTDPKLAIVYNTVAKIATQEWITMPEVWYYQQKSPNAFATGPSRNKSLVAVSTWLMSAMTENEIAAVVAHEMTHIMNGDMVTMTLLQWIMNTFIIFFSRVAAQAVSAASRDSGRWGLGWMSYFLLVIVFDVVLGFLASFILMAYSRKREFRADAGAAGYVGSNHMIDALRKLGDFKNTKAKQDGFAIMKISWGKTWMNLMRSHPPIEKRIEALQNLQYSS